MIMQFSEPCSNVSIHVRLVPAAATALLMMGVAILGFHPSLGRHFPAHFDKVLHLVGFAGMTFTFYWIFYVPVDSTPSRNNLWNRMPLLLTASVWFSASVISEFAQTLVPSKTFQVGDILANIGGTAISLWLAYKLDNASDANYESLELDPFDLERHELEREDDA
ncbi:hypothetical protein P389DRAFT_31856 [Cystobasidium minutum MCA 4210]|uniref:uncharacterized protein n=1 Tax=Cystobasidium minutum MCA 4210 TaxID=1397322 RepID=UPI0034CF7D1F|eukprot:jgi/Rhomi1/31856/CE31855_84